MRIKEIERTANISWSPAEQYPIYMVTGTAAQQLDATFSTNAALEVYNLNLEDSSLNMPIISTTQSEGRFHKVLWSSFGMTEDMPTGMIVGGTDSGGLLGYSASKLLDGNKDCLVLKNEKHTGAVKALDFNSYQHNLLASGGSDSEIYVWDLNKPETPMTPGTKSQPPEEVACVAWNKQVQHIIASTFASRCVVWDLRKNEPIIKVSDSMSRIKSKLVVWHPDVATQMCISSEDDHTPVIQLWDLRYATSPLKVFENHTRGILSMAWSQHDSDLLLSCAKDNRILCWNPNTNIQGGEVVYELPTSNQWCFDVQWCPRNPAILSSSSFDGHITVYSLMGGGHPIQTTDKASDSFHTTDSFAQATMNQQNNIMPLQKPPKWLRRPVGASFGFGGKLLTFETEKMKPGQQSSTHPVYLSQVVTENDLLNRSLQLEQAMNNNQFHEFCSMKSANCTDPIQENIWSFLQASFEKNSRDQFIHLLGYDKRVLGEKISEHIKSDESPDQGVDAKELAEKMTRLDARDSPLLGGMMAGGDKSPSWGSKTPGSRDELSGGSAAFDDIAAQSRIKSGDMRPISPLVISTDKDAEGLLSEALLTGNYEAAVEMCLHENKMAEAILLAIAGGTELLKKTQKRYFEINKSNLGRLISSVVTHDWKHVVRTCSLDNWKEALAVVLSYSSHMEYADLCDTLATRLENEGEGELSMYASLCYICSGNVEKLVENWYQNTELVNTSRSLQDLVEKVTMLRKAVELSRGQVPQITTGRLAEKLSCYAGILAAQGSLDTAIRYLGSSNELTLSVLRERLYKAIGQPVPGMADPDFPFQKVNIQSKSAPKQPAVQISQTAQTRSAQKFGGYTQPQNSFQTVTTASTSYSQYQSPYAAVNGSVPTQPQAIYNPAATAGPQLSPTQISPKGHLSHRYPSCPAASAAYGLEPYSSTAQYSQAGYNTNVPYSQPDYYSTYNPTASQPVSSGVYNPTSTLMPGGQSMNASSIQSSIPSFMDHKPTSAWNDPPAIQDRKPKQSCFIQPAAITAPVMDGMTQQMVDDQAPPGAPVYSNLYNPQEHQVQPQTPPPPEPVKEIQKGPIPAEHQILQDIFNSLVHNCLSAARNAQTKRKLEDVNRKLELLYDRLRADSLSQSVILGLHQIVQAVQQYDYSTGLQIYTQLVSQGNFSEISSFMPGLKMLIQSAHQLQVYVQAQ
ncbi:hypothetical protein ScPMuIL_003603 [Solemya velum]